MNVYETESGMYRFTHLPVYAQFILDHHLDAYVEEQIQLSHRINLPLLKYLRHLSPEELFQQSKKSSAELLTFLADNKAKEFLQESMNKWMLNQLELIGKFEILAEDITLINYIREEALRRFIPLYTTQLATAMSIVQEIDLFILGNNTTATNTYIQILQSQVEEETHFRTNIITASPGITYIFDLVNNKGSYVNGKVKEVMGYSAEEVLELGGNIIASLGHKDDIPLMRAGLQQMILENSDRTFLAEFRLRDKWGVYKWLRSYLVVFRRDANNQPLEVLGQVYEITKEKELVQAVEKREQQLLEAQSLAKVGSFDWDLVADKTEYTPELRQIFEEEMRGYEHVMSNIHPDDRERVKSCMEQAMVSGLYECEYRYRVTGKEKVLWAKGVIVYEDGKPVRMIGTVQDISLRKKIEDSLLEKTIELEKSNNNLQEFASVTSHDLKEPLRKIITFADLLANTEKEKLSGTGQVYLTKVIDSAQRMKTLIEDILAYSTLSGKEEKQIVPLKDIVQEVLNTLEVKVNEKVARIEVSGLPEAKVYPLQMQQLFQNLISNALKFSREDVPLTIAITHQLKNSAQVNGANLYKAAQYLEIKVSDNGIGFNKEANEKIFGLFNRLHNRSKFEGTGLGLAICRKVAENHGGTIYADSEPGQGSVFTVLLPLE